MKKITIPDEEVLVDGLGTGIYVRKPTTEELRTQYGLCLEMERIDEATDAMLVKFGIDRKMKKIIRMQIIEAWCS